MNKIRVSLVTGSFAAVLILQPSIDVSAQSGSRICGWKTTDESSYEDGSKPKDFGMAIIAEIGGKKNKTDCDITTKSAKKYVNLLATVIEKKTGKTIFLHWKHMRLQTCENFARVNNVKLDGQGIKQDICDHIPRHQGFQITKPDAQTKATFTPIKMTTSWQGATRDFFIDLGDVLKSSAYAAGHALKTLQEFMWKATVALEDVDFKSRPSENAYGKSGITNGESGYSSGISMSQNIRLCASLKYIPAIPKDITEFKRCGGPGKIKEDLKTTAQIVTFAIKPVTAPYQGKPRTPTIMPRNGSGGFVPPRAGSGRPVPAQDIVMVAIVDVAGTVWWERPGATWSVAGISFPAPGNVLGVGRGQWMSPAYENRDQFAMKCLLPFKKQGDFQSKALRSGADFRVSGASNNNDKAAYKKALKALSQIQVQNKKSDLKGFLGFASPNQATDIMKNGACYYQDPIKVQIAGKYNVLPPLDNMIKSRVVAPFEVNLVSEVTGEIISLTVKDNEVDYKAEINLGLSMEFVLFNNFMNLYGKIVGGNKKFSSKAKIKTPPITISGSEVVK